MPNRTSAEEIRQGRNRLTELAEQAGRDPNSIAILAFGHAGHFKSRDQVQELQEAGANRVTLWLEQTEGDGALAEMEAMARQVV
jgi:alkanesulfonate monooxygenase SsuD/methylene tetrahydromethanopterin reductase-like flavin-dependent oxidoreductase (luciferase family)